MIRLLVRDFQWIKGMNDDPGDQCAHGRVILNVNDTEFVKPEDGIWTISASALYLLRTLSENHTAENSVAESNFLFSVVRHLEWIIPLPFAVINLAARFQIRHI